MEQSASLRGHVALLGHFRPAAASIARFIQGGSYRVHVRSTEWGGWCKMASLNRKEPMNASKIVAIVLIAAGVLALVYGSFSYTKDTTAVKLGPIELSVKEKETVNVPMWVGVGAIVVGGLLLVLGGKKG
jgi:hypothetical protein